MPEYRFAKHARADLLDELAAAGVPTLTPEGGSAVAMDDTTVWVTADAAHQATVAAVVAAHDVASYQAKEDAARHTYEDAIAYLQQFEKQPSGTATNVQRDNAIKSITVILKTQHQQLREQQGAG